MAFMVLSLLMALVAAPQQNVTGKWHGTITAQREDGATSNDPAVLILQQKDKTITGTVGGSDSDQHPITNGTIDGNKLSLTAKNANDGREYQIELTLENDELKGTLTSGTRKGQIHAKKRKE